MPRKPSFAEEQWIGVDPVKAAQGLLIDFGPEAAAESLLRAYLAEHWGAPDGADFWVEVRRLIRLGAIAQLDTGRS